MSKKTQNTEWLFGIHTVQTLIKTSSERIVQIWVSRKTNQRLDKLLLQAKKADITVQRVNPEELDSKIDGNHQGVCAECTLGELHDEKWLRTHLERLDHPALLLILDGVTDPHNLGACLRTADASGVDAVIIPKDNSAGLTAVARKVASGAADSIPLVAVTNLARCMAQLQQNGIWITGAADETEQSIYDIDFSGAVALAMGAEGSGLRRLTREHCDQLAAIPMHGEVSSLNVSVATGVCLYEVVRQRQINNT